MRLFFVIILIVLGFYLGKIAAFEVQPKQSTTLAGQDEVRSTLAQAYEYGSFFSGDQKELYPEQAWDYYTHVAALLKLYELE